MRYIRTKDVYGKEVILYIKEDRSNILKYCKKDVILNCGIKKPAVIISRKVFDNLSQADTIEELCDEFVYGETLIYDKEEMKFLTSRGEIVYGAIWTSKGLIYVAKMNEKGELELL